MASKVRVRFAPSPTGEPHVGNLRTAVFTWLFARHAQGSLIVRIEDTDQERKVEGAVEMLLESLRWLGLDWDEGPEAGGGYGPYFQSQRLSLYRDVAGRLLVTGDAYNCYCSPERLAEVRKKQAELKQPPGYDRRCRNMSASERREQECKGTTPVVRFKVPAEGVTTVNDLIRGEVSFENNLIDDFVIMKSDGFPTYHLAHLADDQAMEITHVLRAEEWLPSTPRHLLIYKALNWEPPRFAHLPIILAPDRSKLSKRHGATSVLEYRAMGYLPDAMLNFLALLGWSLDDKTDIISRDDLIRHFSIERVGKSGAVFNSEKLEWMNGHYMRELAHGRLAELLLDYWGHFPPAEIQDLPSKERLIRIVPLIQERMKTLKEAAALIAFFFKDSLDYEAEDLIQKGMNASGTKEALQKTLSRLQELTAFDAETTEASMRSLAEELGLKAKQLFGSLRIATTGQRVAPPLFESMEVLGRDRSLQAIEEAIRRL